MSPVQSFAMRIVIPWIAAGRRGSINVLAMAHAAIAIASSDNERWIAATARGARSLALIVMARRTASLCMETAHTLWLTPFTGLCVVLTLRKTQSRRVVEIYLGGSEPPVQVAPLMQETERQSLFRRQSHHECTFSRRSPTGRHSREFNRNAVIRASARVALYRHAADCLARNPGVDRHSWMAGGQGLQPLVTQSGQLLPIALPDCRIPAILVGNPLLTIVGRSAQWS
jgi:hypothetical protein